MAAEIRRRPMSSSVTAEGLGRGGLQPLQQRRYEEWGVQTCRLNTVRPEASEPLERIDLLHGW